MTRSNFMKCCAAAFVDPEQTAQLESAPSDAEKTKRQLDAARKRFASLVTIITKDATPNQRKQVLESLGSACAKGSTRMVDRYKNDLPGYLAAIQKGNSLVKVEHNQATGTILLSLNHPCSCPLVKEGETPAEFCQCSAGWFKQTYSAILGRPVQAEVLESRLRGGTRCAFRIQV